ncbi:MAG: RICIN domain-containing protein [Oscillospiraceae bacterium]|nr:RICIN domain-containing protein [Oscillospiraceae bacterium]
MKKFKRIFSGFIAAVTVFTAMPAIASTSTETAEAAASYPVQEFRIGISNTNRNVNITGTTAGSQLNSWTTNGVDNEKWTLNYISAGVYEIVNVATGMVITGNGSGAVTIAADSNGAAQRWKIEGVQKDFEGYYLYYKITNNSTGQALTFLPDGNYFTTSSYSGAAYQKFKLNLDGQEGYAANAKVSGGEKAGTIGGLLGATVYVDTVDELESALDSTDPLTVVLTADLDMKSAGFTRIRDNKTLVGSYSKRKLQDCQIRTNNENGTVGDEPSDNIVIRNIHFVAQNVEDKILLQIWSSRQIWIDHNTFTSNLTRASDEVGKFIWLNTPYDNYRDAKDNGRSPDYITISYCRFTNRYWTVAYGTQNTETTRCRTTLNYNWWENCARRCPQIGNGNGHVYNNYYSFSGSGASEQIIVGDGCNMLSENCMFEGLTGHEMIGGGNSSSPFTDSGSYTASSIGGSASKINYKTSYGTSLTPKNHYGYSLLSAYGGNDTKTFCKAYAGCFGALSSIVYITDSNQSSKPVTKHNPPHLSSIDVTDGGAVADFVDGASYMIKNVNSGLYIDIDGAKAANSTNAQKWVQQNPASRIHSVSLRQATVTITLHLQ